jgi:hypothetical protein
MVSKDSFIGRTFGIFWTVFVSIVSVFVTFFVLSLVLAGILASSSTKPDEADEPPTS